MLLVECELTKITRPVRYFVPKITSSSATTGLILLISFWVVLLGGVLRSPFSVLLALSPLYYLVELTWPEKRLTLLQVMEIWKEARTQAQMPTKGGEHVRFYNRLINWLTVAGPVLIAITLLPGEFAISRYSLHTELLGSTTRFEAILQSYWYVVVFRFAYYVSVGAAVVGVLPPETRAKLIDRVMR
jgi:hypothetical protein